MRWRERAPDRFRPRVCARPCPEPVRVTEQRLGGRVALRDRGDDRLLGFHSVHYHHAPSSLPHGGVERILESTTDRTGGAGHVLERHLEELAGMPSALGEARVREHEHRTRLAAESCDQRIARPAIRRRRDRAHGVVDQQRELEQHRGADQRTGRPAWVACATGLTCARRLARTPRFGGRPREPSAQRERRVRGDEHVRPAAGKEAK